MAKIGSFELNGKIIAVEVTTSRASKTRTQKPAFLATSQQLTHKPPMAGLAEVGGMKKTSPAYKKAKKTFSSRAQNKFNTMQVVFPLIDLGSPLQKSYWSTYYCASQIIIKDGKAVAKEYCGKRWCSVCGRIKTAQFIERYTPAITTMQDKQFYSLSVRNVPADELRATCLEMVQAWRDIMKHIVKYEGDYGRFTTTKTGKRKRLLNGFRKLEVTYNSDTDTYHPHFHILIEGFKEARLIANLWAQKFGDRHNTASVQISAVHARDMYKTSKELFKYVTKLNTGKRNKTTGKFETYPPIVLDTIFQAIKGLRIIQTFGKVAAEVPDIKEDSMADIEAQELGVDVEKTNEVITFTWREYNWFNDYTGAPLIPFVPRGKRLCPLTGHLIDKPKFYKI